MIRTKTIDYIKFGLFCALLFIVVIEFMISFSLSGAADLEELLYYLGILTNLGILDTVFTISLLGVLAFPRED